MYPKHVPKIIRPLARDLVFTIPNNENAIYLSFDDGPHPEITPWILDQLDAYYAKATFFLIGSNVEEYPALLDEIVKRGHAIGNHSMNHLSGWKTENTDYFNDVSMCQSMVKTTLFRPPYGQITRAQAKTLKENYHIIMWSDLSADFDERFSGADCIKFATQKVTQGSIIVFHDSEKAWPRLKESLTGCLKYYQRNGFKMNPISIQ